MPIPFNATERQREIYLNGITGKKPLIPTSYSELKAKAKTVLSPKAWAYIAGGSGLEDTMNNNRQSFDTYKIIPRILKDISERDIKLSLFKNKVPAPILLAPVGAICLAHPEADLAVAKGAAALGIPMIFSNQASHSMEACAAVMGDSPRWFQLYWSKSNELTTSVIQRAESCGCSAIVVTLDTPLLGWRPQDLNHAYVPFLEGRGIAQYTSDPVFQKIMEGPDTQASLKRKITFKAIQTLLQMKKNYPGGLWKNLSSDRPVKAVRRFTQIFSRPTLTWEDLKFLRKQTQLPILLKGVLHPQDAQKAIDFGMDGIIVSNHGGRQVDGCQAAFEALPGIIEVTQGQIKVLMDSGIRSGADIFKALALGADAVCIGRPFVYALALAGADGVQAVLQNLAAEFEITMALAGCRNLNEINRSCLTN